MMDVIKAWLMRFRVYVGAVLLLIAFGLGGWAGAKIASHFAASTIKSLSMDNAELQAEKLSWNAAFARVKAREAKAKQAEQEQAKKAAQASVALRATVHKADAMRESYDKRLAEAKARAEKMALAKCGISQAVVPPKLMGY